MSGWWSAAGDEDKAPHRPSARASFFVAALAIGVVLGFVGLRGGNDTPVASGPPLTPSTAIPGYATPSTVVPTTSPTTTTSPPPPTTTVPTAAAQCTPADLSISTTSDASSYSRGQTVTVTTSLKVLRTCTYVPVPTGQYSCASSIVVTNSSSNQVWPSSAQSEQCSQPKATVMVAGFTEILRAAWNQQVTGPSGTSQAGPGTYRGVGTWSWSSGSGAAPYVVSAQSADFSIS